MAGNLLSMRHERLVSFLLRFGLAAVFLYAAVAAAVNPANWLGFVPGPLHDLGVAELFLYGWSAFQMLLALWLLSGRRADLAGLLAAASMLGVIVPNLALLDIVFRDAAILCSALALAALHWKRA